MVITLYTIEKKCLYVLVYAKDPKFKMLILNISTALSHKRITIVDIEKAFSFKSNQSYKNK